MRKEKGVGGMGMLLVLFPQDSHKSKFTFPTASKAQSTISICALLLFTTLLLFTLSTLPTPTHTPTHTFTFSHPHALQRMGTLHRRGTKSMPDLIICHVPEETPLHHFRLFLRLLHRSSLTASSDVVFLFPSPSHTAKFSPIIRQENQAFSSLLHLNSTRWLQHPNRFHSPQPLWGTKTTTQLNSTNSFTYGSLLSFDATELDPENSLAGFLDRVPLSLRRWACYPMLLGRVRRNFKHLMLVDVKNILILKDPLAPLRNRTPDSVLLFNKPDKHAKRAHLLSTLVMGGARGVRRLSAALLLEIVRAATHHSKRKNAVSESAVLSQLVGGSQFLLKNRNVHLIVSTESIPEAAASSTSFSDSAMLQRGVSNHDLNHVIMTQICSSLLDSSVYTDC